jgi:hypothetical protein
MANRDQYEGGRREEHSYRSDRDNEAQRWSGQRAGGEDRSWTDGGRESGRESGRDRYQAGSSSYGQGRGTYGDDQGGHGAQRSRYRDDQRYGSHQSTGANYGQGQSYRDQAGREDFGQYAQTGAGGRYSQDRGYSSQGYGQYSRGQDQSERYSAPQYHAQGYEPGAQIWNRDQGSRDEQHFNKGYEQRGDYDSQDRNRGQGQSQGRDNVAFQSSVGDFEPDYLHWRDNHVQSLDRDYHAWRDERRDKFHSEFNDWRSQRAGQSSDQNSPRTSTGASASYQATTTSPNGGAFHGSSSDGDRPGTLNNPPGVQDVSDGGTGRDDRKDDKKKM